LAVKLVAPLVLPGWEPSSGNPPWPKLQLKPLTLGEPGVTVALALPLPVKKICALTEVRTEASAALARSGVIDLMV
jgi:hypothetical protein